MTIDYQIVDVDNHYYEPDDCFTRHIEPEFAARAVNIRRGEDGLGRIYIGDSRLSFHSVIQTDHIGAPGTLRGYFAGEEDKDRSAPCGDEAAPTSGLGRLTNVIRPRDIPEFMGRDARLKLLDQQNVQAAVMLPTLGVCVEHQLSDDVPAALANLRSFNRWLDDDWGYDHHGRILGAPLVTLLDLDFAIEELDRVLAAGARLVVLRIGPVLGRSPADPYFDPFWARVAEAGIPVALHVGDSGYTDLFSRHWGEKARPVSHRYSAFQVYTCLMERPIDDMLAALLLHNLFARFPQINIMSIENGSTWVAPLLKGMDKAWRAAKGRTGVGGEVTERPSDVFRRHVFISPFPEDDIHTLAELIGPSQVLFGSDYPHPEGVAEPIEFADELVGMDPADVRIIMRDSAASLLGLSPPS
jgi:predicted TIM-barrel fold metal-dependent hydrolase